MRAPELVRADMAALKRPSLPVPGSPAGIARWREDIAAWRDANPDGDARYEALLGELDAIDAALAAGRERESWGQRVGIPARTLRAALEARDEGPVQLARTWVASGKPWLVLMGSVGTGKSVGAAWALLQLRGSALWVSAAELATKAGGFSGAEFAERLKGVEVLVVDDVGTEHANDFAKAVMAEVLTFRHEQELRTIVTTNLAGDVFRARMGTRLADRIRSACVAREFGGASLRGAT